MGLHKVVLYVWITAIFQEPLVMTAGSWYKTIILVGGSSCLPGLPGTFPMHTRADILFRYCLVSKQK
jgi:hypothetical protein